MSSAISNDLAGVADRIVEKAVSRKRAMSHAAAQQRSERSIVNKAVHAAGGEAQVFHHIAGGMTVSKLCETLGLAQRTFYDWIDDQTLEIADSATPEDVQVAKLRTDIRLKLAARHNRAYFGESQSPLVSIDLGSLALDALRRREIQG
jgi:hypothetical protein